MIKKLIDTQIQVFALLLIGFGVFIGFIIGFAAGIGVSAAFRGAL